MKALGWLLIAGDVAGIVLCPFGAIRCAFAVLLWAMARSQQRLAS